MRGSRPKIDIGVRLENRLIPVPECGCLLWTGTVNKDGYGVIRDHNRKRVLTHRVSYTLHVGDIPAGLIVMHKCDTRSCCEPTHLSVGTHEENFADMYRKGRSMSQKPRATTCRRGHPYNDENTRLGRDGQRFCRQCERDNRIRRKKND